MTNLLLRNVRPMAGDSCDVLIKDGKIAGFGQFAPEPGMPVEDGGNSIVMGHAVAREQPGGRAARAH